MTDKSKLMNKLATCSLLVGGLAVGAPQQADATVLDGYRALGTGGQVRAQLLGHVDPVNRLFELKGEEGKCGEGKCGEGKCGEDGEDGHDDKSGDEAKCGEGKCGEGKCGS